MQESTADVKHRMISVWKDTGLVDSNTHNKQTGHSSFLVAIPFSSNEHMLINVPRYLHLDLPVQTCYAQCQY